MQHALAQIEARYSPQRNGTDRSGGCPCIQEGHAKLEHAITMGDLSELAGDHLSPRLLKLSRKLSLAHNVIRGTS